MIVIFLSGDNYARSYHVSVTDNMVDSLPQPYVVVDTLPTVLLNPTEGKIAKYDDDLDIFVEVDDPFIPEKGKIELLEERTQAAEDALIFLMDMQIGGV